MSINQQDYEIQSLLGKKRINGITHYLIQWKNYPKKQATWEPLVNLENIKELIIQFETQGKKEQTHPKKGKKQRINFEKIFTAKTKDQKGSNDEKDSLETEENQESQENQRESESNENQNVQAAAIEPIEQSFVIMLDDSNFEKYLVDEIPNNQISPTGKRNLSQINSEQNNEVSSKERPPTKKRKYINFNEQAETMSRNQELKQPISPNNFELTKVNTNNQQLSLIIDLEKRIKHSDDKRVINSKQKNINKLTSRYLFCQEIHNKQQQIIIHNSLCKKTNSLTASSFKTIDISNDDSLQQQLLSSNLIESQIQFKQLSLLARLSYSWMAIGKSKFHNPIVSDVNSIQQFNWQYLKQKYLNLPS